MKRKILILGRSASGKDTLAIELTKQFGLKQLISTTTRPKRYENENAHVFVSEEEADTMKDRVAETVINGYQYFATRKQLDECDVYVIDPNGLYGLCENAADVKFCVVYVSANNETRKTRAMKRAADKDEAAKIFDKRHADENAQFLEFEDAIYHTSKKLLDKYPNIEKIMMFDNNDNDTIKMRDFAELVKNAADY